MDKFIGWVLMTFGIFGKIHINRTDINRDGLALI